MLVAGGCKKERDTFGVNMVPEEMKLRVCLDSMQGFPTWNRALASRPFWTYKRAPVGEWNDPTFGKVTSFAVMELYPLSLSLEGFELESVTRVELRLSFTEVYGEGAVELEVGRLQERIDREEKLDTVPRACDTVLGLATVDASKREMVVELPKEFGQDLMDSLMHRKGVISNWTKMFPGIQVQAHAKGDPDGCVVMLDATTPLDGITVHWAAHGQSRSTHFGVNQYAERYFCASYHFGNSVVGNALAQDSAQQSESVEFFLTAGGGVEAYVDLSSFVERWRDSMPVTINRAELRIPCDASYVGVGDSLVYRLAALREEEGHYYELPDWTVNPDVFGGYYQRAKGYYRMNITLFVQQLLKDETVAPHLCLRAFDYVPGVGRVVLRDSLDTGERLGLHLTYIKH